MPGRARHDGGEGGEGVRGLEVRTMISSFAELVMECQTEPMAITGKTLNVLAAIIWGLAFFVILLFQGRSSGHIRPVDIAFMGALLAIIGLALWCAFAGSRQPEWFRVASGLVLLATGIAFWFVVAAASG